MDPHKRCSSCLQDLPLTAFDRRRHYVRSGVRAACRACTRAKAKQQREQQKEQRQAAPDRTRDAVRARTRAAIARGALVPAPCVVCGVPDVEAHHPDYERVDAWAHVEWLCRLHHAARHGRRPWTRQLDWLGGA